MSQGKALLQRASSLEITFPVLQSGGTAPVDSLLRGELFKAGKDGSNFKLRWCELNKRGEFHWAEGEGSPSKGVQPLRDCQVVMEKIEKVGKGDTDVRYGFSIHPPGVIGKPHKLQASSLEERQLWVDALERSAHPEAHRASLFTAGRVMTMSKPSGKGRLGLELADSFSLTGQASPCVTVTAVEDVAAESGLLVGDVVLMMGPTVLRNHSVALRCFASAQGAMTLTLAAHNREVGVVKRATMAGIQFSTPPWGPGVLVSSLQPDGAGAAAGLHLGDRILSINSRLANQGGPAAMEMAKEGGASLKLAVCGVTTAVPIRKDADGRLGLQFVDGTPSRSVQGPVIASVLPRSAAREAGLRNGDLVTAVDEELVFEMHTARELIGRTARGLTLVIWRPNADAPSEATGPTHGRATASQDAESQKAVRQEWYFSTDVQKKAPPQGAHIYEDLTVPVER